MYDSLTWTWMIVLLLTNVFWGFIFYLARRRNSALVAVLKYLRDDIKEQDEAQGPYEGMYSDTLDLIDNVLHKTKRSKFPDESFFR